MPKGAETVASYAEHWLTTTSAPPFVTPYTSKVRRQFFELYIRPYLGDRLIAEIDTPDLVDLQRELFGKKLATSTVRHVFSNLVSPIMRQAKRERVIGSVPDMDLVWPREVVGNPDPFTVEERERILADFAARGPSWNAAAAMVLLAGLRPSEAVAMSSDRFNPDTGEMRIDRSLVKGHFGPTKTRAATRTIVVPKRLRDILAECLPHAQASQGRLFVTNSLGKLVDGNRWSNRVFRPTLQRLKIRARGLYCGRHTAISITVSVRNANITKAAAYFGTSVVMIERHYLKHLVALTDPGETPITY